MNKNESIEIYKKLLLKCNRYTNLISRKITSEQLDLLIDETFQLSKLVMEKRIIDAGSGNGLLGIPFGIIHKEKEVILVETRKKKIEFLIKVIKGLGIKNIKVEQKSIHKMLENKEYRNYGLLARGFPKQEHFINYLERGLINRCYVITSEDKIKKLTKGMVKIEKRIYNIDSRDMLKILVLENVSRETQKKL
jgi:16S rRNA G527 N7-methylase RsmG